MRMYALIWKSVIIEWITPCQEKRKNKIGASDSLQCAGIKSSCAARQIHTYMVKNNCKVMFMREILAQRLKQCRKENGWTQWEMAVYCDITEHAYQNYELMAREPKLEILVKIAERFGVSLDYLVGRTDNKAVNV